MGRQVKVLVLGAGLTGLTAAWRLKSRGLDDLLILERHERPGGLLKTNRSEGVEIDHLPHVFFTKDEQAAAVFRDVIGDYHSCRHNLGVMWKGRYVEFPFQNHVNQLDIEDRRRVLRGLLQVKASRRAPPRNLEEYAVQVLGDGIVDLFFRPYNEKLWQTPLARMDHRWVASKIRLPDTEDLADSILGTPPPERGDVSPHAEFFYPRRGGIESLIEGLAGRVGAGSIRCRTEALEIDPARRVVRAGGESIRYEKLISTLPLAQTVRLAGLRQGRSAAARLRANRVVCLQYVLKEVNLPDYHWIYVPDPGLPFYRLTRIDLINPAAAPGRKVLLVECALPGDRACADVAGLAAETTRRLEALGVIPGGAVERRWEFDYAPAYAVPHLTHGRDTAFLLC